MECGCGEKKRERHEANKKSAGSSARGEGNSEGAAETEVQEGRKERNKTTLCHNLNEP